MPYAIDPEDTWEFAHPEDKDKPADEQLVFTKDSLYSWNAQLSKWVLKATYLAAKVDEQAVFVTTDDQVDAAGGTAGQAALLGGSAAIGHSLVVWALAAAGIAAVRVGVIEL